MNTIETTEYSKEEQEILYYLTEKYSFNIIEVEEAIITSEVDLDELTDYINAGDRVDKTKGEINITTRRPKADIEETIRILCPTVIQILSSNEDCDLYKK